MSFWIWLRITESPKELFRIFQENFQISVIRVSTITRKKSLYWRFCRNLCDFGVKCQQFWKENKFVNRLSFSGTRLEKVALNPNLAFSNVFCLISGQGKKRFSVAKQYVNNQLEKLKNSINFQFLAFSRISRRKVSWKQRRQKQNCYENEVSWRLYFRQPKILNFAKFYSTLNITLTAKLVVSNIGLKILFSRSTVKSTNWP